MSFRTPTTLPARLRDEEISPSTFGGTLSLSCSVLGEASVQTTSPLAPPYNPSLRPLFVRSQLISLAFLLFRAGLNSQPFSYISLLYLLLSSISFFLYCSDTEKFNKAVTTLTAMAFTIQLIALATHSCFRQMRPKTETLYSRTSYAISIGSAILTTIDYLFSMSFDVSPLAIRIQISAALSLPVITTLNFAVTWLMWMVDFMVRLKTKPAKLYGSRTGDRRRQSDFKVV